jgi:hypothetical protein
VTLASDIITAAYRESNLIPLVATPSTAQQTEALNRLNPLILSTVGSEAGSELSDLPIGGEFDRSDLVSNGVPRNARLIVNLSGARSINLDPCPYEGQRVAIADAGANFGPHRGIGGGGRYAATPGVRRLFRDAPRDAPEPALRSGRS